MDLIQIEQAILRDPSSPGSPSSPRGKRPSLPRGRIYPGPPPSNSSKDYDLALPEGSASLISEIEQILGFRFFKVGREEIGTITYRISKSEMSMDVTFLQGRNIEDDLQRRDFTINAMAFSLEKGRFTGLIDPWRILKQADSKRLRSLHRSRSPEDVKSRPLSFYTRRLSAGPTIV